MRYRVRLPLHVDETGAVLGGEQSGHIILGDHLPTGDGLLTSLHVLAAARFYRKPLSALSALMKKYPQVLLNIKVKERIPLEKLPGVKTKIEEIERILGDNGRVLVRYSGTEPLLRIMLEGPDRKQLDFYAGEIAHSLKKAVGE
jgi:phosphoglucosamine mutase